MFRYRWAGSSSYMYVDVFPPRSTVYTVSGLKPSTTYNFSVNAINSMGESSYADNGLILSVTTMGQYGALTWTSPALWVGINALIRDDSAFWCTCVLVYADTVNLIFIWETILSKITSKVRKWALMGLLKDPDLSSWSGRNRLHTDHWEECYKINTIVL